MSEFVVLLLLFGVCVLFVVVFLLVKWSEIFGWCCFDFVNLVFMMIIIMVIYV